MDVSRDGKVRNVGISYKHDTESGERKLSIVDRPVRECIRLLNIEDTSLLEDIAAVKKQAEKILDDENIFSRGEADGLPDVDKILPRNDDDERLLSDKNVHSIPKLKPSEIRNKDKLPRANLFNYNPRKIKFRDEHDFIGYFSSRYTSADVQYFGLVQKMYSDPKLATELFENSSSDLNDGNVWTETLNMYDIMLI